MRGALGELGSYVNSLMGDREAMQLAVAHARDAAAAPSANCSSF